MVCAISRSRGNVRCSLSLFWQFSCVRLSPIGEARGWSNWLHCQGRVFFFELTGTINLMRSLVPGAKKKKKKKTLVIPFAIYYKSVTVVSLPSILGLINRWDKVTAVLSLGTSLSQASLGKYCHYLTRYHALIIVVVILWRSFLFIFRNVSTIDYICEDREKVGVLRGEIGATR
jgi:hypothetical protein